MQFNGGHDMKKFLLAGAVVFGALLGVGAQAAPVTGPAAIQVEAVQADAVQKVFYRGGRGRGYGRWGYRGYHHYGRYGYRGWGYRHWGYRGYYGYDRGYYGDRW
jgi:hypothetical protein